MERIAEALQAAASAIRPLFGSELVVREKSARGDPLTEADTRSNAVLRRVLPRGNEGWLSEESGDDGSRLGRTRVWVVYPLDGTREFVDGIPEWCISVGLVENGVAVAGGILNPLANQLVLGAVETGVTLNGRSAVMSDRTSLGGASVFASRSEVRRGEWKRYGEADFSVRPCGSVAYKLGLVAAGLADATWTLTPKNEWDVAGGTALVLAAGGVVQHADGSAPRFNRSDPGLPNLLAGPPELLQEFRTRWLRGVGGPSERVETPSPLTS